MHYEVYRKMTARADHRNSTTKPTQYPCVELVHNDDWNDYTYFNWFSMWFFISEEDYAYVGDVKIMTLKEISTKEALSSSWDGDLDDSFCSLGLNLKYYKRLKETFNKQDWESVLKELRDSAFNPQIYELFQNVGEFRDSLLRDQASEEALKYGKIFMNDISPDEAYSFTYFYHEPYGAKSIIEFNANFLFDSKSYQRTIGIIGVNGTGKTQLLRHLTTDLIGEQVENFSRTPLFDSCVVLYSTPFDNYPTPIKKTRIPIYSICMEQKGAEIIEELKYSIQSIMERPVLYGQNLTERYLKCITEVVGDSVDGILECVELEDDSIIYKFHPEMLEELIPIFSSGQLQLFSMITHVFSRVHLSSIFIIDEPEVHLHPHTILSFMRTLAGILHTFKSYAIIATHSPLIVRELVQSNVQVFRTVDENINMLSPISHQTFGEDITLLYYNIFGYNEKDSYFTSIVTRMLRELHSYERVIEALSAEMSLSLNAQMIIRNIAIELNIKDA